MIPGKWNPCGFIGSIQCLAIFKYWWVNLPCSSIQPENSVISTYIPICRYLTYETSRIACCIIPSPQSQMPSIWAPKMDESSTKPNKYPTLTSGEKMSVLYLMRGRCDISISSWNTILLGAWWLPDGTWKLWGRYHLQPAKNMFYLFSGPLRRVSNVYANLVWWKWQSEPKTL